MCARGKSAPVDILKVEYEIKGAWPYHRKSQTARKPFYMPGLYALTGRAREKPEKP